jgi:hypothetical protein
MQDNLIQHSYISTNYTYQTPNAHKYPGLVSPKTIIKTITADSRLLLSMSMLGTAEKGVGILLIYWVRDQH